MALKRKFTKMEKWWGFECGENLENTQMVSIAWRHGVWPPGTSGGTKCCRLECCVLGMSTVSFGLESADGNCDGWGG